VPATVLEEKFRGLVAPRYGAEVAERAIAAVRDLARCPDVAALCRELAPGLPDGGEG
jgi:hypothetical protein